MSVLKIDSLRKEMMKELDAVYQPKKYESKWYNFWMKSNYFHAPINSNKKPFTILMPPPNVTSQLHMGHGTGYSIQDLLIRWKRMSGYNACWLPGTDHAGIATQMMVEKDLEKDGQSKVSLGRDKFLQKLESWKDKYGGIILEQFKQMGFSCDWERLAYTMDPGLSKAVRYVFVTLYEEGLIYRGERLVNWDCKLKTALSDDELENIEVNGKLWHFRYPIDGSNEQIPIATTRPETMLGDTAVAVNPEDSRYNHLIGKSVRLPFTNRKIPIIADDYVKSEFGTGAVKITPAHDPNDFAIGKRHQLPMINILNEDGTLNELTPKPFRGMDRAQARKEIIKAIKELGLFDEEKPYKHVAPHSERSKTIIEPKLSKQWYVRMQDLAKPAAEAARSEELKFYPNTWKKTYLYWLDNIQDWCISRQLWWGHRIPIWYCNSCDEITTGMDDPQNCSHCGASELRQDEDVLDTWFSSWLWPLSPFGWPEENENAQKTLSYFNPTDVLVTAPEIIFLWVARMVMANLKFKKSLPFENVYFNATICDHKGRKFSKTLGNGIDPLEVVDKHGADAVRFTALSLAPLGGRVKMSPSDFDQGARFVNKVWNAARFLLQNVDIERPLRPLEDFQLTLSEKWLINELHHAARRIDEELSQYRINEAVESLYHFIWGSFCDWGVECAKDTLSSEDKNKQDQANSVLVYTLEGALRLAHPVIPFVTEELWQHLPKHPNLQRGDSICIAKYPKAEDIPAFENESAVWKQVQELITAVRSARQQAGIKPKEKLEAFIRAETELAEAFLQSSTLIRRLAGLNDLQAGEQIEAPSQCLTQISAKFELFLPVGGLLDIAQETKRLEQEKIRLGKILQGIEKKLGSPNFVERAPADIIEQTQEQKLNISHQLKQIHETLKSLQIESKP